jgi:hypothetical protein
MPHPGQFRPYRPRKRNGAEIDGLNDGPMGQAMAVQQRQKWHRRRVRADWRMSQMRDRGSLDRAGQYTRVCPPPKFCGNVRSACPRSVWPASFMASASKDHGRSGIRRLNSRLIDDVTFAVSQSVVFAERTFSRTIRAPSATSAVSCVPASNCRAASSIVNVPERR